MKEEIELPFSYVPKLLNHYEAMHPMTVLEEFFDDNSLEGHASEWKAWRDCAASDESYSDERYGPSSLLHLHRLNVKLLEALYLLLLSREARPFVTLPLVTQEQLAEERSNWSYFPDGVAEEYLYNPFALIKRCFRHVSMQEYHYYLEMMLKEALSIRRNAEVNISAHTLLRVYEEVLLLQAAAWLLHQRHTQLPSLRSKAIDSAPEDTEGASADEAIVPLKSATSIVGTAAEQGFKRLRLTELNQELSTARMEQLVGLCNKVIPNRLPYTKAIYLLGEAAGNLSPIFLFIIVDPSEDRSGSELADLVERCCRCFGTITPIICNEEALAGILAKRPYFFSRVLHECKPLFASPYWQAPEVAMPDEAQFLQQREVDLAGWQPRYEGLLRLANQAFQQGEFALTLVLLDQALPIALSTTISYRTGYWLQNQNPVRLLKLSRLFTPTLAGLFEMNLLKGKQRMSLLTKSYRNYIHTDSYAPGKAVVEELFMLVNRAVELCREACRA